MWQRILRFKLLPHSSSQASNKFSSVFRQRTAPLLLRPSFYIYLGVSAAAATFATVIAIHHHGKSDSAQAAPELESNSLHTIPKSPTTDETFDLSSGSATILKVKEKAVGINRVDTILLARYVHTLTLAFISSLPYSKPNQTRNQYYQQPTLRRRLHSKNN